MRLERHVISAIDDYEAGKFEESLMHACLAIDGTARKLFGIEGRKYYKKCIRDYYWMIEIMIGGGINLDETKWDNIDIQDSNKKKILNPGFDDVIYHIFRCNHAHANEVPRAFDLLRSSDGSSDWHIAKGVLQMPDRVIWALLAVSLFCKANADIQTHTNHYLFYGSNIHGIGPYKFPLKMYWGKEEEFRNLIARFSTSRVTFKNLGGIIADEI